MGSIRKRSNGRWEARWWAPDRTQRSRTFDTKREAADYLAAVTTQANRGEWVDPRRGRITVHEWAERWWPSNAGFRASTRENKKGMLELHILPALGDRTLGELTPLDMQTFVASLIRKGLSPATVRMAYGNLRQMLAAAVDAGLLARTPCHGVKLPRVEVKEKRFLTPADVARLANAIHPRYRALVYLAAYGGLRLGELSGLKVANVHTLPPAYVDIVEGVAEVGAKVYEGPLKSKASRRRVRIPQFVAEELAEHIATRRPDPTSPRVFQTATGLILRQRAFRSDHWLPAIAAAGLEHLRFHDLRHTAVALWIAEGASAKQVQARAGHASAASILDTYGHLFPDHDDLLTERLDQAHKAAVGSLWDGEVIPFPEKASE